jgi:hypothetical protein
VALNRLWDLPSPRAFVLIGLALALSLIVVACGATQPAADRVERGSSNALDTAPQVSEGGQVTIKAIWRGPGEKLVFDVALDTHVIDLDGYDLRQLASLRTDQGREVLPVGWDAPSGGHHRSGTLTFPATGPDGNAVLGPGTGALQLVIRDVAGVSERVFTWQP